MTIARHIFDPATGRAIFVTPDDPSLVGMDAPIGSLANKDGGGRLWSKFGAAITDWSEFAASSGFLPLSGGSLNPAAILTVPGLLTAQGGLTVSGGAVSFPAASIADTALSTQIPRKNAQGIDWTAPQQMISTYWTWTTAGVAAPTFTTRSAGTKIVIYPSLSPSASDYGIGMDSATMWFSVAGTGQFFKWYGGITLAATLTGAGVFTVGTVVGALSGNATTATSAARLTTARTIFGQNFDGQANVVGDATINRLLGGVGAESTGGTLDWNHVTNSRSGSGYSLLLGTATNGPGGGYYHPFNFEYVTKDGSGELTQLAIAYAASPSDGLRWRGRYGGIWSSWYKAVSADASGNVSISGTLSVIAGVLVNANEIRWTNNQWMWATAGHQSSPNSIKLYDHYLALGDPQTAGSPPDTYGTLLHIAGRSAHLDSQLFFDSVGKLYYRNAWYGSDVWSAWRDIISGLGGTIVGTNKLLFGTGTANALEIGGTTHVTNSSIFSSPNLHIDSTNANHLYLNYYATGGANVIVGVPGTSSYKLNVGGDLFVTGYVRLSTDALGLYSQFWGIHFRPMSAQQWQIMSNAASTVQLAFAFNTGSHQGSVYADSAGFGLLDSTGTYRVRVTTAGGFLQESWTVSKNLFINTDDLGYGLVGIYAATKYRSVYAMGASYQMATDGSTLGTLYGMFYGYDDAGVGFKNITGKTLQHGLGIASNGVALSFIGNGIWTSGNMFGASLLTTAQITSGSYVQSTTYMKSGSYFEDGSNNRMTAIILSTGVPTGTAQHGTIHFQI